MTKNFTYSEMMNGNVTIRTWVYPAQNEMDVETWIDDNYVSTVTVPLVPEDVAV